MPLTCTTATFNLPASRPGFAAIPFPLESMSYTKTFLIDARNQYQEYCADFDPTPLWPADDYRLPMSFDDFAELLYLKQTAQPYESADDDGDWMAYSSEDVI